jgi:CRISPR type I-E-associated protein CasB/Cse2
MDSAQGSGEFVAEAEAAALAGAVRSCRPGEQAALRRMVPSSPPPVFYRLLLEHISDAWNGPEYERAWTAVMQGMALLALSAEKRQDKAQSLGSALGRLFLESGESRFWRLLQADDETFYDLLRHIFRMLAGEGSALDWMDVVRLCLLQGKKSEEFRRRLARDFCRAQRAPIRKNSPEHPETEQGAAS